MTSVNSPACLLARNQFYRNVESSQKMTPVYGLSECSKQTKQRVSRGDERLDVELGAADPDTQLHVLWAEQPGQPGGEVECPRPEERTSAGGEHSSAWLSSTLSLLFTAVWTGASPGHSSLQEPKSVRVS